MSELIERLRGMSSIAVLDEAASEIERLRANINRLTGNPADHRYWEGRWRDEVSEITRLQEALAAAEARIAAKDEALEHARHVMWEYGFSENDLQPVREAIDLATDGSSLPALLAETRKKALEEAAQIAAGKSGEFDFGSALAECRDSEHGFHSGRLHAAAAIRALAEEVRA